MQTKVTDTAEFNELFTFVMSKFIQYELCWSFQQAINKLPKKTQLIFIEAISNLSDEEFKALGSSKQVLIAIDDYKKEILVGLKKAVKITKQNEARSKAYAIKQKKMREAEKAKKIADKKNAKSMFAKLNFTAQQKEFIKKMVGLQ